jgi:MFS family permease
MLPTVATIGALLASIAILVTGNGLQNTLISVRANLEGFPTVEIGLLVTGYYVGFMAGAVTGPRIIMRVGHIRAFAVFGSVAAAAALVHALAVSPLVWLALRAVSGLCFAGLYMVIESWLNERAPNETRGKILSIYRIIDLTAAMGGQLFLTIADPRGFVLFSVVSILICLAVVPVALTTATIPAPISSTYIRLARLFQISPLGVVGCFSVGVANAAFWGLAPVAIQIAGLSVDIVAYFMSVCIIGGIVFQWPAGQLSDRFDRRTVLVVICLLAAVSGVAVVYVAASFLPVLFVAGFIYGGLTMPLYTLCIAHANDNVDRTEFVAMSGGLLLVYGVGAVIGPVAASLAMSHVGGWALFGFIAMVHGGLAVFGVYRMTRRRPVPIEEQAAFIAVPRTTPAVFELDPRGDRAAAQPSCPADERQQTNQGANS